jgi:NAD-dependent dihydropyrimidine dehydrogenase PreA subunit
VGFLVWKETIWQPWFPLRSGARCYETQAKRIISTCPGGVAQWTSPPPQEQEDPGSNPDRA